MIGERLRRFGAVASAPLVALALHGSASASVAVPDVKGPYAAVLNCKVHPAATVRLNAGSIKSVLLETGSSNAAVVAATPARSGAFFDLKTSGRNEIIFTVGGKKYAALLADYGLSGTVSSGGEIWARCVQNGGTTNGPATERALAYLARTLQGRGIAPSHIDFEKV